MELLISAMDERAPLAGRAELIVPELVVRQSTGG